MKKCILFVHQSADLYGSDRVLLALVTKLDHEKFLPIVFLPVDGPLVAELRGAGVECHVLPIARLSRKTLSLRGLFLLPAKLIRSMRAFNQALNGRRVDAVHSNTLAVLSGAIWARWYRIPHVWHVHEIIVRPKLVRKVYAWMLSSFADCIICVSLAAKNNLLFDRPALSTKIQVVWNGLARESEFDGGAASNYRHSVGMRGDEVLVVLLGRINRLKGQRILLDAAEILWRQNVRNLRFVIVGSVVPGQEHFLITLQQAIAESPARQCFVLQPFTQDVWPILDACDIAVIPSTEPESFGMVALEAMAAGKPIVAANHGGLTEIVEHKSTGLLVKPSDATQLADALLQLASNSDVRVEMGRRGQDRWREHFSLETYIKNMGAVYGRLFG